MPDSETNNGGVGADPSAAGPGLPRAAPERGQPVEVTIDKLVYGGSGLARTEGRVVLAPFVLPGETVRVTPTAERPGMVQAAVNEIVHESEHRTDPPCPYFYRCGGCHYQHARYEFQVEQKRAIVEETLRRLGKVEPPGDISIITGEPWGYRNRTQFHIEGGRLGYFGFGTHDLVAVERCPISSPKINDALSALTHMIRDKRWPRFVRSVELFTNEQQVQVNVRESERPVARRFFDWCAEAIPGFAPDFIEYRAGAETYRVGRNSFFQVNRFLTERLVERALEGAEGQSALDLYAGVGLFSLPLARRFAQVDAVESGGGAVRDLEFNAQRAGVAVTAHRSSAESFLDSLSQTPDLVLADPPRAGLGKVAVRALLRLKPPRIAIVSCDPSTLARDLAVLTAGGYRLKRLTLVDLFPQTFHIETIVNLDQTAAG